MGQIGKMIIRKMRADEIDTTVNLFKYYIEEANLTDDQWDENSLLEGIREFNIQAEYCWLNAYEGQRPIGLVAGCLTKPIYSRKLEAHINYIFLLESHRNMANFRELVTAFESWASSMRACEITAGDIGINPDRTRKLFTALDFREGVWLGRSIQ